MCILPGIMQMPMMDSIPEEIQAGLHQKTVYSKRLSRSEEFALPVCHRIENSMLNAEATRLDGGMRLY